MNDSLCACFSWTSFNGTSYVTSHLHSKYRRLVCCSLPFHHTFLILQTSIKWWEKKSDMVQVMPPILFCSTLSRITWLPWGFWCCFCLFVFVFVLFYFILISSLCPIKFSPLCFSAPLSSREQIWRLGLVLSPVVRSWVLEYKLCFLVRSSVFTVLQGASLKTYLADRLMDEQYE